MTTALPPPSSLPAAADASRDAEARDRRREALGHRRHRVRVRVERFQIGRWIRDELASIEASNAALGCARMAEVETKPDGAVLTITLNRPDVLNAFNAAMHEALGRGAGGSGGPVGARGRAHGSGPWLLRRPGPDRVPRVARRHRRPPAEQLPPERARDPRAREAGDRGRQRRRSRRGPLVRLRLRPAHRRRLGELRPGLHQHRPRPGLGRHVLHRPPAGLRARVRVDDLGPQAHGRRGSRVGARLGGRRGRRAGRAAPQSSPPSTRRARPAASA